MHGRCFIGMDIETSYLDLTIKRFQHQQQDMLDELANQPTALYPSKKTRTARCTHNTNT
jgi:DNA modification methylase